MTKSKIFLLSGALLLTVSLAFAATKVPYQPSKTAPKYVPAKKTTAVSSTVQSSVTVPQPVMGIYSTSWIAGSSRINELAAFIKNSKINSLVIDIKDDTGYVAYPSQVPMASEIGSIDRRIPNIKELVTRLKAEGVYTIARIVVFKDPLLAKKRPDIAVKDIHGGLWHDRQGMTWVDPNCRQVWKYNLDIAKEAVSMGFSEIQFDYVRFLSDGKISDCVYPYSNGASKEDVIHDFLLYAKKDLNQLGVPLSADIFGLVLSVPDDNNIGQKLEKIAAAVDYISPMVYPSHYPKGYFGIMEPNQHPYEIIDHAMKDALRRIAPYKAKLRPWLQDFDLGYPKYGREQLQAQIKALEDNGIHDWLMWNPRNIYDLSKY